MNTTELSIGDKILVFSEDQLYFGEMREPLFKHKQKTNITLDTHMVVGYSDYQLSDIYISFHESRPLVMTLIVRDPENDIVKTDINTPEQIDESLYQFYIKCALRRVTTSSWVGLWEHNRFIDIQNLRTEKHLLVFEAESQTHKFTLNDCSDHLEGYAEERSLLYGPEAKIQRDHEATMNEHCFPPSFRMDMMDEDFLLSDKQLRQWALTLHSDPDLCERLAMRSVREQITESP